MNGVSTPAALRSTAFSLVIHHNHAETSSGLRGLAHTRVRMRNALGHFFSLGCPVAWFAEQDLSYGSRLMALDIVGVELALVRDRAHALSAAVVALNLARSIGQVFGVRLES
jgi:hypothetical protein